MYVLTVALFVPYFYISYWKWTGRFMCSSLYVQFGDAYGPVSSDLHERDYVHQ